MGKTDRVEYRLQMLAVAGLPCADVHRERFGILSAAQMYLGGQAPTATPETFTRLAHSLKDLVPLFSGRAARWRAPAAWG